MPGRPLLQEHVAPAHGIHPVPRRVLRRQFFQVAQSLLQARHLGGGGDELTPVRRWIIAASETLIDWMAMCTAGEPRLRRA